MITRKSAYWWFIPAVVGHLISVDGHLHQIMKVTMIRSTGEQVLHMERVCDCDEGR